MVLSKFSGARFLSVLYQERLLVLVAAFVMHLPALSSASPTAILSNGTVQVSNEFISISLDARNGSITSIVDVASGINLTSIAQGAYHATWGVNQSSANGSFSGPYTDNNGSGIPGITLANSSNEASATLVWTGLNFANQRIGDARITVMIVVRTGDPLSHWTFRSSGLGGISPTQLSFPILGGIGILGATGDDNRYLVPEQDGRLYANPVGSRLNNWVRYPTSYMSMQFSAYYNSQAGFYLGVLDSSGQSKALNWFSPATSSNSATWTAQHFFPDQATDDLTLTYEVVIGVFHGDWTTAAGVYKSWAAQQSWTRKAISKTLPSWFRNGTYARFQCAGDCGLAPQYTYDYAASVAEQAGDRAALGGPTLVWLNGWEKLGLWVYGDELPPSEGWPSFDKLVTDIHQQGNYLQLLGGVQLIEDITPLWESGAANASTVMNKDGSRASRQDLNNRSHTYYYMNPASSFWQQNQTDLVASLASHNIDAFQFDGWPIIGFLDDYSPGHPLGFGGNWQWLAWEQLLIRAEQAGRSIRPDLGFSTEEVNELLLPYITHYTARSIWSEAGTYSSKGQPVPAFGYVYKPYIQAIPDYWPLFKRDVAESYHRLALARALVWGQAPPFIYGLLSGLSRDTLNHYSAIGKARTRYSRFLLDGSMLPPPTILTPPTQVTLPVDFVGGGNPVSVTADSVQSGAWVTPSGELGVILINISQSAVDFALPVDFTRWKLAAGQSHSVTLNSNGNVQLLGSIAASSSFGIALDPMQIALITIQVPTVVEFYNPDLDNFFITADPSEQAFVDSGAVGRWQRTGNTFKAGGTNQVCRFYGNSATDPTTGALYGPNSHFYTADATECDSLKALFNPAAKSWKFESNDFAITPASSGGCGAGLAPVYRAYNNGFARGVDSNHRITSNFADYQQTLAAGWTGEGVAMCATN